MAGRGPDGRMVPTNSWRAHTPTNRDATRLSSNRIFRPNHSWTFRSCSSGATSTKSPLETGQPEREQTPGSKNLRRKGKYVLRSDPMEGNSACVSDRRRSRGALSGGPRDKLCGRHCRLLRPSEEPNEAMADRGPDGRMVPTNSWRTHTPTNRAATRLSSKRTFGPNPS